MQEIAAQGRCTCGHLRYTMKAAPLFVHCCHCTWCQCESGSAFALNAMIESEHVALLDGEPEAVVTPSLSGKGQTVMRCPHCRVAVWSHYAGFGTAISYVRIGTLEKAGDFPPDIHIFAVSKQPWVVLPDGPNAVPEYYNRKSYWTRESLDRLAVMRAKLAAASDGKAGPATAG